MYIYIYIYIYIYKVSYSETDLSKIHLPTKSAWEMSVICSSVTRAGLYNIYIYIMIYLKNRYIR